MADKASGKKQKKKVNPSQEVAVTGLDGKKKASNKKAKINDINNSVLLPHDTNFGIELAEKTYDNEASATFTDPDEEHHSKNMMHQLASKPSKKNTYTKKVQPNVVNEVDRMMLLLSQNMIDGINNHQSKI